MEFCDTTVLSEKQPSHEEVQSLNLGGTKEELQQMERLKVIKPK